MNFLAPLFLLGALAVAAPLFFHLNRGTTREVTRFSTLMFLQPTPLRATHRTRLENLWLLLLRCLVIALLALGFSRPFLRSPSVASATSTGSGRQVILLIDTSASMRREELFSTAQEQASGIVRGLSAEDRLAIMSFDRSAALLVSFEEWQRTSFAERAPLALARIQRLTPSWAATQLDQALIRAAEMRPEASAEETRLMEIIVISDLQEGSRLDALQGFEWPRRAAVSFLPIEAKQLGNASMQAVSAEEDKGTNAPRIRVTAGPETQTEQFSITNEGSSATAYVPPGQSRVVAAPGALTAGSAKLTLTGDETAFDNTLHLVAPAPDETTLHFFGMDTDSDPKQSLFYLRRAFPAREQQSVKLIVQPGSEAPAATALQQARLVVLGNGGSDAAIVAAEAFAQNGGSVFVPLTSAEGVAVIGKLLHQPQLAATEAAVKDYALLGEIDFQHPLFSAFADPRFGDFTKTHFWKYRRFDPAQLAGARVVARFDSGDPAWLQVPLGRGSVFIFTSSWRPEDSDLALSSKLVPLLHALLEQSSNSPQLGTQYVIGDEVPLPESAEPLTVRTPDGATISVTEERFTATDQPGIYTVEPMGKRFAVNLAPDESRTSPLPADRFSSLGVPKTAGDTTAAALPAAAVAGLHDRELESRQKPWRWLVIAALGILFCETLLAAHLTPRASPSALQK